VFSARRAPWRAADDARADAITDEVALLDAALDSSGEIAEAKHCTIEVKLGKEESEHPSRRRAIVIAE
jgi:hypothetical protein